MVAELVLILLPLAVFITACYLIWKMKIWDLIQRVENHHPRSTPIK